MSIYLENVYQSVVAEKALLSFGVDAEHISQPLFGSNAVVKVASMQCEYALRLHRASRSPQRIDRELAFVSALGEQNAVRVPRPVKTISGDYTCTVFHEGNEFRCSLLTWIKGEPRNPGHGFGVASARQAGAALGAIHRYSQSLKSPLSASGVIGMEEDFRLSRSVQEGDAAIVKLLPELATLTRALRRRLEVVLDGMPESGVIHGDFILKNLLCHRTLGIGVLDFDDSVTEYYVLDLAGMLENLDQVRNERGLQTAFIAGYAS
ncbi:MAG: phosphotransferase, partial [Pseudomonadota bacterium]